MSMMFIGAADASSFVPATPSVRFKNPLRAKLGGLRPWRVGSFSVRGLRTFQCVHCPYLGNGIDGYLAPKSLVRMGRCNDHPAAT